MNISDEHISAFLDAELEPHEMAAMRAAIAQDEAVAERVEAFAAADAMIKQRYSSADELPMPQGVLDLIKNAEAEKPYATTADVVEISRWQQTKKQVQEHFAVAASVTMMVGVGLGVLFSQPSAPTDAGWQQVSQHLDSALSGETNTLADGAAIKVQLSFTHQDGRVCRQYYQQSADANQAFDNVACKYKGQWQLSARVPTAVKPQDAYATASRAGAIDSVLDSMIADSPMSFEEEQAAIAKQWRDEDSK